MALSKRTTQPEYKPLRKDSVMRFGQYKGETVEYVMKFDPAYLLWALDHVDGFDLATDTFDALVDYLYPIDDEPSWYERYGDEG